MRNMLYISAIAW